MGTARRMAAQRLVVLSSERVGGLHFVQGISGKTPASLLEPLRRGGFCAINNHACSVQGCLEHSVSNSSHQPFCAEHLIPKECHVATVEVKSGLEEENSQLQEEIDRRPWRAAKSMDLGHQRSKRLP